MTRGDGVRRAMLIAALVMAPVLGVAAPASAPKRKPDLGDAAQGTYEGDVISDSKGASRSGVTLTVTRIGKNLVRVTADYQRLPAVEVTLTRAVAEVLQ